MASGWLAISPVARACATCAGESDSKMAEGMTAGILALLLVIFLVLGGVVGFFAFLAHRAAAQSAALDSESASDR